MPAVTVFLAWCSGPSINPESLLFLQIVFLSLFSELSLLDITIGSSCVPVLSFSLHAYRIIDLRFKIYFKKGILAYKPKDKIFSCSSRGGRHCHLLVSVYGEGNGNPLQYSCLGNIMDRGAWQGHRIHGVAKNQTQLSKWTHMYACSLNAFYKDNWKLTSSQ